MPRIDEALARARNTTVDDLRPVAVPGIATESAAFPTEEAEAPEMPPFSPGANAEAVDLEPADAVVLGPVQGIGNLRMSEKLTISANARSIEQYRRIATRLHLMQSDQGTRVVMVTSALPGEGKTLTAANLALTLSESYRRQVLLIDADLRRPSMHEIFQVPNITGLNDGLRAEEERKVPLIRLTDHLSLLTAGRPDPDPTSVLSSDRMERVIQEAQAKFEWVVIDTPPIGLLTDAHLLMSLVHTALLVVHAGCTPLASIKAAIGAVGRDKIAGVVLNRAEEAIGRRWYYYNKYDGYYDDRSRTEK